MSFRFTSCVAVCLALTAVPARAQTGDLQRLQQELQQAREQISSQQQTLSRQEARLQALEARLGVSGSTAQAAVSPPDAGPAPVQQAQNQAAPPIERVGEAPADADRAPAVAVLGDQGSVVTRAGQLTAEVLLEYGRADRNRAIFRGIELPESVLIGVFDINESRQDVLTAAGTVRYGITDRFEVGVRLPYVYRSDTAVRTPILGSANNDLIADDSANGNGIGDLELSARYQIASARGGWPFLIANLQAVIPTGTSPFDLPRDENGIALDAATGSGFYGISPSVTAILPTDPAVLFGTLGYTFNLGDDVNTRIPPVIISYVDPGDAFSASAGIGISLNQRTSINLGYAHSWAFGTWTRSRFIDPRPGQTTAEFVSKSRDLQIGRFLFGMTYRVSDRASLNWSVEVGATDDATDLRTVLRIPFVLMTGG